MKDTVWVFNNIIAQVKTFSHKSDILVFKEGDGHDPNFPESLCQIILFKRRVIISLVERELKLKSQKDIKIELIFIKNIFIGNG